jgi:hypothetical protein
VTWNVDGGDSCFLDKRLGGTLSEKGQEMDVKRGGEPAKEMKDADVSATDRRIRKRWAQH